MAGANLIVFRDTSDRISGKELGERLLKAVAKAFGADKSTVVNALLIAGGVESAVADCGGDVLKASQLTDGLAASFVGAQAPDHSALHLIASEVGRDLPESARITEPEGFAYYALHPRDFADAVAEIDSSSNVAVIGIRTIGTILSAVATAELKKRGIPATRITVRPKGHPYDRKTQLDERQVTWVQDQHAGARFLITDEGPGLSGSSFLSVAECLSEQGVRDRQITMLGTSEVNPGRLCAADAAARWVRFGWRRVGSRISHRFKDSISLSAGTWRDVFLSSESEKPACWAGMEETKYWSADRKSIFKFEGFGEFGSRSRERSWAIYEAGFAGRAHDGGDGMSRYEFVPGTPLTRSDISAEALQRIAEYCAFRAREFKADRGDDRKLAGAQIDKDRELEEMVRFNFSQLCGRECPIDDNIFRSECPVIADARMHPHEWIGTSHGKVIKVDGARHGDDHFFPGPTDIAWDLAGAIVEWSMDRAAQRYLLERFKAQSGLDREPLLPTFVLAYSIFRASYCEMARLGTSVEPEKPRLKKAHLYYLQKADAVARQFEQAA